MSERYDTRKAEIERRKAFLLQQLNRPIYKPNLQEADDYYARLAAQQKLQQQQQQQKQVVKQDTSKKHSLLDALMNNHVFQSIRQDFKDTKNDFSDGVDFQDFANLAAKPYKYMGGEIIGSAMRGVMDPNAREREEGGLSQWSAEAGQNFKAGMGDLLKGVGDTATYLGSKDGLGGRYSQMAGKEISDFAQKNMIDGYEKPYSKKFTVGSLIDPEFYSSSLARSLPFTLSLIMPSLLGAKVGAAAGGGLANVAKLGNFGKTVMKTLGTGIGSSAVSVPAESLFEAASVYDDAIKSGATPEEADVMADKTFKQNAMLLGVTQVPEMAMALSHFAGFNPGRLARGAMIAGGAGLEGVQEAGQEVISAHAKGEKVDKNAMWESATIGALMGGGMGALGAVQERQQHRNGPTISSGNQMNPNAQQQTQINAQPTNQQSNQQQANQQQVNQQTQTQAQTQQQATVLSTQPVDPEEQRRRAQQILGGTDPQIYIRNQVRTQLPEELKTEVQNMRELMEMDGNLSPEDIEFHLDEFIASRPEGNQLIQDVSRELDARLNPAPAPSPQQAEQELNQTAPEQAVAPTEQPVQEPQAQGMHPLQQRYLDVVRQHDAIANEHDQLVGSEDPQSQQRMKQLQKELKPFEKQIKQLEKQMGKAKVSVPGDVSQTEQAVQAFTEQVNQVAGQADQMQQQATQAAGPTNGESFNEYVERIKKEQAEQFPNMEFDEARGVWNPDNATGQKTLEQRRLEHEAKRADYQPGDTVTHVSTGQVATFHGEPHQTNGKLFKVTLPNGKTQYWSKQKMKKGDISESLGEPMDVELNDNSAELDQTNDVELSDEEQAKQDKEREANNSDRKGEKHPIGSKVTVKKLSGEFEVVKNSDNATLTVKGPKGNEFSVGRAAVSPVTKQEKTGKTEPEIPEGQDLVGVTNYKHDKLGTLKMRHTFQANEGSADEHFFTLFKQGEEIASARATIIEDEGPSNDSLMKKLHNSEYDGLFHINFVRVDEKYRNQGVSHLLHQEMAKTAKGFKNFALSRDFRNPIAEMSAYKTKELYPASMWDEDFIQRSYSPDEQAYMDKYHAERKPEPKSKPKPEPKKETKEEKPSTSKFKVGDTVAFTKDGKEYTGWIREPFEKDVKGISMTVVKTDSDGPVIVRESDLRSVKKGTGEAPKQKTKEEMMNTLQNFFNEADGVTPTNVQAPTKYDKAREKLSRLDRLAQKADQYLKDNKDRMNALPLDLYAAAAIVGANKIAHGVVDFAEWSEQMIKDYGPKLRLSLRSLYVQSEDIANFSDEDLDEYLESVGLTHFEEKEEAPEEPKAETATKKATEDDWKVKLEQEKAEYIEKVKKMTDDEIKDEIAWRMGHSFEGGKDVLNFMLSEGRIEDARKYYLDHNGNGGSSGPTVNGYMGMTGGKTKISAKDGREFTVTDKSQFERYRKVWKEKNLPPAKVFKGTLNGKPINATMKDTPTMYAPGTPEVYEFAGTGQWMGVETTRGEDGLLRPAERYDFKFGEEAAGKSGFKLGDIVTGSYEWNEGVPKYITGFVVEMGEKQLRIQFPQKNLGSNSLWIEIEKTKPATSEDLEKAFAKAEKEFSPSSHAKSKKEAEEKLEAFRNKMGKPKVEKGNVEPKPAKDWKQEIAEFTNEKSDDDVKAFKKEYPKGSEVTFYQHFDDDKGVRTWTGKIVSHSKDRSAHIQQMDKDGSKGFKQLVDYGAIQEYRDFEMEEVDEDIVPDSKPSKKSDEYQVYQNGDYVEWTDRETGETKTGYVSGHVWDGDKPGTLRPADTILVLIEGEYTGKKSPKGVRAHLRPDTDDITIIEKAPENPTPEQFIKGIYRHRLDVDPKEAQERMKENGHEPAPVGQILLWKNEVVSAGKQKAKQDSETSRTKKIQSFVESYQGSVSKRQAIMNEFRKANPDHAKIRKELEMDTPAFTDFLIKEVEKFRAEQYDKERSEKKAEEAKKPQQPKEELKDRYKIDDLITFHSKKLNKEMKGYVVHDAPQSQKVNVIYTNGERLGGKFWVNPVDDIGKEFTGSEWVNYSDITEQPQHSLEDRKYMSLSPNLADIEAIKKAQPPNILLAYDKWGKSKKKDGSGYNDRTYKTHKSVKELVKEIGYSPENIIFDSGAFAFWDKQPVDQDPEKIYDETREHPVYGPVLNAFYEFYADFDREEIRSIVVEQIKEMAYTGKISFTGADEYDPSLYDPESENYDEDADPNDWVEPNEFIKYADFILSQSIGLDSNVHVMSFDKVGDPDFSWMTYNALVGVFENVIPTFHYGTDMKHLEAYVKDGADYIALGGSAKGVKFNDRVAWANEIVQKYPKVKFHMLGTMDKKLMAAVPGLYSLDGSGWVDKTPGQTKEEKPVNSANNINKALGKNEAFVTTQAGTEIKVEYEVVPMFDLIKSTDQNGKTNKDYPKALQPRDRSSADSLEQIQQMARNLDPERLGTSRMASDGAPIVGPDNVVESGNGRMAALHRYYLNLLQDNTQANIRNQDEQDGVYLEWLKKNLDQLGLKPSVLEDKKFPVLIRRRLTDVDREKFVAEANESSVSRMGATETAQADAKKMKSIIHLFVPSESGDVNTVVNQEFIKKYINEVVPSSERREVRTKEGYLSQDGKERLERALFALAYNDERAIAKYSEDLDDNARTVTGAMTDVAPKMAVLNADIESKSILSEFDLSKDVVDAFNQLVELRRKGEKIPQWIEENKKQESLFEDTKLSDSAYELLHQFDKLKSRQKIRAILFNYVDYVMNDARSKGEDLFGDRATKEEFLQIAIERMNGGGDLFELKAETRPSETPDTGEKPGTNSQEGKRTKEEWESWLKTNRFILPRDIDKFLEKNAPNHEGFSEQDRKIIGEIRAEWQKREDFHVQPLPEDPTKVDAEHFKLYTQKMSRLIEKFKEEIEAHNFPTGKAAQGKIREMAKKVLNRPAQEDEWRDALEAAIQLIHMESVTPTMSVKDRIVEAQVLEKVMKTSGRSMEQMERQQFSTPIPLAEIVRAVSIPKQGDVIRESSAGTGSLILPFMREGFEIRANELSPRRAAILEVLAGYATGKIFVTNEDTFKRQNVVASDVIVGNPPFKGQNKGGGTVELSGSAPWKGPWGDLGNRFLAWDLRVLNDGGRLVYVVSGGVIDNQQNAEFRKWLKANHTVLAMVKFPAGVYDTRGTKFPTGLIVVEKGKKSGDVTPITGEYETLDSLLDALQPLSGTKQQVNPTMQNMFDEIGRGIAGSQTVGDGRTLRDVKPDKYAPQSPFGHWLDSVIKGAIKQSETEYHMNLVDNVVARPELVPQAQQAVEKAFIEKFGRDKLVTTPQIDKQFGNSLVSKFAYAAKQNGVPSKEVDNLIQQTLFRVLKDNNQEVIPNLMKNAVGNEHPASVLAKLPQTSPEAAEEWKELKRYMTGDMNATKANHQAKHLQKMKNFAEKHGIEWTERMEGLLDKTLRQAENDRLDEIDRKAAEKRAAENDANYLEEQRKKREEIETSFQETADQTLSEYKRYQKLTPVEKKSLLSKLENRLFDKRDKNSKKKVAVTLLDDSLKWDTFAFKETDSDAYIKEFLPQRYYDGGIKDIIIFKNYEEGENNEVVSDKGKRDSGTGNRNEDADVRGQKSERGASAGSESGGKQSSGSGREGTASTGTVHAPSSATGTIGGRDGSPTFLENEQEVISTTVPAEVEILDRGESRGNERKNANGPTDSVQPSDSQYVPRRVVTGQAHRGHVTEAPNMRFVKLPDDIFEGDKYLPHPKVTKGGKFKLSDVQVETIMAAKYNFELGKRGMLIADDTGMGKTAQQLGIAADAFYSGRTKRILIVTTNDQVASVNFPRDNENLGLDLPITWIASDNNPYSKKHGKGWKDKAFNGKNKIPYLPFQVDDGVIIMSKVSFREGQESVIKWLDGANGDVTIIMDESHEFNNRDVGLGKANVRVFEHFKDKAQYIYASATAAEDIDGLEHMYGLHKWDTSGFGMFKLRLTSADTKAQAGKRKTGMSKKMGSNNSPFHREVPLTMMEQLTRELKMDGQYIGRNLSMEGVKMEGLPITISPKEEGDWNRAVQFIGMIAKKAEMYGRSSDGESNPKARGQIISQVVGYMRRISGYYRMKSIIADIQKQMDSGEFKRFGIIGEFVKGDDGKPANLFAAINVINDKDEVDTGDDVEIVDIPEAVEDKKYLLAILHGLNPEWGEEPVPNIPNPMQMLYDAFGEENVAVISGEVDGKQRPKVVEEFQNMKRSVIWFNKAGGTGVDMHDTVGTPIRVYTQDYAYTAKAQKQAEGRFHRTGQVTAPTFVYPYLNSSTDTKFVGTLIARYETMGALSRGDVGKLGGDELSRFDLTGEAAEEAVIRIIPELDADVRAEMFGEFTRNLTYINDVDGGLDETAASSVYSGNKPEVKKFLNALMYLDYKESSRVFEQFTEKLAEVEKELEEKGGVKDKFETYQGKEVETQVGKNGIKLRRIQTILTENQQKALDYDLKKAQENEQAMIEEYEKVKEETLSKLEKQVKEMTAKQQENATQQAELTTEYHELMKKLRTGEATDKDTMRSRTKLNALIGEFNRRAERLKEAKTKLKGLQDGNEMIVETIPDMRRAQSRKNNARATRLGAEANVERSKEILLVDGKIATNGLLVNIRQAIRTAAVRVYGEKHTPASALTLELRGYTLENGERAIGAVVPKWAEGEVAKALEARMSYSGETTDVAQLDAFLKAGNKVSLQGGYELEYHPRLKRTRINGMTAAKDKDLFKSLNKDGKTIGFEPVSRNFIIENEEGLRKFIEKFPILEKKVTNPSSSSTPSPSGSSTPPGTRTVQGIKVEVKTDTHTKTGETIWLVKAIDNVPNWGVYGEHMKKHGGRYYGRNNAKGDMARFLGNFVFQKDPEPAFDKEPNPPMGDDELANRVNAGIPSNDNLGFAAPLPFGRRNSSSQRPYALEGDVIRERVDNAMEIPEDGPFAKLKGWLERQVRRITREFEHLPHTGEFSPLRHELLRLEKQRATAMETTVQNLRALVLGLNKDQYELFRNVALMADLTEELKLGHDLPFDFTEQTLRHEYNRAKGFLAAEPKVAEAINLRKRTWNKIKADYIKAFDKIDVDVSDKFQKENYFRHKVIEFAQMDRMNHITGQKRVKTPKGQGYMKKREGSKKDFVTDYLYADAEVMANMLFDMEVATTIKLVDDVYNQEPAIKRSVEQENERSYNKLVNKAKAEWIRRDELEARGLDEQDIYDTMNREGTLLPQRVKDVLEHYQNEYNLRLGKNHDNEIEATAKSLKGRVGWAYAELKKMAVAGDLWTGKAGEYDDLVEDLANGRDNRDQNRWFAYLSDLLSSGEDGDKWAGQYLKYVRVQKAFTKDLIGEQDFKTIQNSIPEGYDVWRADDSNVFYMANTLPDYIAERLFNGVLDDVTEDDFTKAMVFAGKRKGFIVKDEVKTTLENMMPASDFATWKTVTRKIKEVLLISPQKLFMYNARNLTGDLDKVVSGNPDSLKYTVRAMNELGRVFFKKGVPTGELKEWMRQGGTKTLLQSQEFGDIKELAIFRNKVMEKEMGMMAKTLKIPVKTWRGYWSAARTMTDYREAILRYATFLSYLEQIEKNNGKPKNYGASLRYEIDALGDKYSKAFNLANDLLIPYDKTSVTGRKLRDTVVPFVSFIEGNIRSYIRLFKNAILDEQITSAVGRKVLSTVAVKSPLLVVRTGKIAMKVAFLAVLTALYNNFFWPDEEEELPEDVRNTVHIIYGRDDDGKVAYFSKLGTLEDFLGWFGLDNIDRDVVDIVNGDKTFAEVVWNNGGNIINKAIQAVHPLPKQGIEQATGMKLFPDFRQPTPVHDRMEHLMSLIGAQKEYEAARDTIIGRPHKAWDKRTYFAYISDPEETNYYNVKDMAQEAAEKVLGKEKSVTIGKKKETSEYLYEIKQGLRYKDMDYAQTYLDKYIAAGGTDRGLKQSLKSLNPLFVIPTDLREEYYNSLDEKSQDKVQRAYEYYKKVLLNGVELD